MALTDISHPTDIAMLTDLYELTMAQGLWESGKANEQGCFTAFYRDHPFGSAYAVMCGTAELPELVENLRFTPEDIDYLASLEAPAGGAMFKSAFLDYLRDFRAHVNIDAVPEGELVFPREPMVRVTGPSLECQLLETLLLVTFNHQCLIATKANRIVRSAAGRPVMEFGARRAQGYDAAYFGARASYIGGCGSTSCVMAARDFGIPASGTMAHSWVMSFDTELEAFEAYADMYHENLLLLADTYHVLEFGVPDAIRVFTRLRAEGRLPKVYGIRIDSGDLAYLSKEESSMFREAGFPEAIIYGSNDLDEYNISSLKTQGCTVSSWGVGTKCITADGSPSLGGVFKMCAREGADGSMVPVMKISNDVAKVTNPGIKTVRRFYRKDTGKMITDLVCLASEPAPDGGDLTLTTESAKWRRKKLAAGTYTAEDMLKPVFLGGERQALPELPEIIRYADAQMETLWPEYTRLLNPDIMEVNLSEPLQRMKNDIIEKELGRRKP